MEFFQLENLQVIAVFPLEPKLKHVSFQETNGTTN